MVDFRYIDDALTPREALDILRAARGGRQERIAELERAGYPAYTSTPGWIGYCRVAGVNENIAILLLAAKFGVPVCPHAGSANDIPISDNTASNLRQPLS